MLLILLKLIISQVDYCLIIVFLFLNAFSLIPMMVLNNLIVIKIKHLNFLIRLLHHLIINFKDFVVIETNNYLLLIDYLLNDSNLIIIVN